MVFKAMLIAAIAIANVGILIVSAKPEIACNLVGYCWNDETKVPL